MSLDTWFGIALTLGMWQRYSGSPSSSSYGSSSSCSQRSGADGEETPHDAMANDACRRRASRSIASPAPARGAAPGAPLDIRPAAQRGVQARGSSPRIGW